MDIWIPTALAGVAACVGSSTFLPARGVYEWFCRGGLWRCPSNSVALTFDDGPDPDWTPPILDMLLEANVRASFFLIGEKALRWPALVRRIASAGHTIGNHTFTHRSLPLMTSRGIQLELGRCNDALEAITGTVPRFVRAPHGRRDFRFYRIAERHGLTPVFWSLDRVLKYLKPQY